MIVIDQISTHHNKKSCACTKSSFKGNLPTEIALVHSEARGKRLNVIDINQSTIKSNPEGAQKCPTKGNLPPENAFVPSAARGERSTVIVIDQIITHHNKIQFLACIKCLFKGNLHPENASVHGIAKEERGHKYAIIY